MLHTVPLLFSVIIYFGLVSECIHRFDVDCVNHHNYYLGDGLHNSYFYCLSLHFIICYDIIVACEYHHFSLSLSFSSNGCNTGTNHYTIVMFIYVIVPNDHVVLLFPQLK